MLWPLSDDRGDETPSKDDKYIRRRWEEEDEEEELEEMMRQKRRNAVKSLGGTDKTGPSNYWGSMQEGCFGITVMNL